ncbi:MAG TPA: hypothetical protein PLV05_02170 [Verrucomicrobiota bacterium]|nr:hypothetical protein [Verrucomicrobiota bacterium]HOQ57378.1 hypothetical protein [Verrucomicrobiota bacterium]HPC51887.1 hypothetical protein [Verrucomicrobiota bacterium]HPL37722.1 hypothetical protein [Verrucomicrobiota bacterium]HRV39112.1 hypothetical protein [Candidatus Paceibacterota bacterium]
MALTLVKEDGTRKSGANSYAAVADGDAYFEGHLYAAVWTSANAVTKAAALVMATRLVDTQFQFYGYRASETQGLQWPRERCPDPDRPAVSGEAQTPVLSGFVPGDVVPRGVVSAVCEMARELLIVDRTAAPPGEGLSSTQTSTASHDASGGTSAQSSISYSKEDIRPVISRVAQAMLAKYGTLIQGSGGSVRLVRA